MKTRSSYWHLLPYIRPQWKTIAQAFACTLGVTVFWPIQAALAGKIANFIGQGDMAALAQLAGVLAVVFLVQKILMYGQDSLMAKAALFVAFNLRKQVYTHLHRLNFGYFETAQTGDLTYRLTEDIDRVGEVVNKVFHDFIPCVLQLIVVLGYMIYLNWQLTLATFIVAPLMGVLIGWFGEQMLKFSRRSQNRVSNLSALLTEVFSGIRLVQAFAAQDYEIARFAQEAEENRKAKYATERLKAIQNPVVGFLYAMSVLLLFFLGGWQISINNLTGAEFVSYIAAVALLIDPIAHLTSNYNEFKQGQASVDRIFELMAIQPTVVEKPGAVDLPAVTGKVEYFNVTFAYPPLNSPSPTFLEDDLDRVQPLSKLVQGGTPVLQNLNLLAHSGEMIALVGASGAGKTTLVNLLPRFYDTQAGEILIDGINIQDVTLRSLRRQIGIVPQETILFSGTIAQNIAFGQAEFDLKDVQVAAEIANAHQFITQFTQGYHTWVGERGVNLSGGQKQRIAIARAVLLNPRILILDEATSALDSESEALVQEALERIMQDRTVFIIAHRLATVRRADRILVVEQGQIMESGTHEQLLQKGDRYARFYAQQFSQV
ncbi:ABC transporter ATP-binding protein [Coleofasciculus sp. FACHB-1120]|uniref:ABC transporter ATP-binding protein n=1 Tax=Coleofasciculus sp. FACHB-1120 TaxID=2692783 RepID=UPI0016850543|nr:ABC transporter ATP-binding protein [Coleofasciculus sp. FACHB-1120]MBD2740796.1 ABC transporter ATP-binding protein [Coleofasciculus sp. FACHB-1120]